MRFPVPIPVAEVFGTDTDSKERDAAMNKNIRTYLLLAFWCVSILVAGCFPDNSLIWSDDGAFGLFRAEGKLFLVEGATGELTPVEEEGRVSLMPGISADGSHITYVKGVGCTDVDEGLRLFPPATTAMLLYDRLK